MLETSGRDAIGLYSGYSCCAMSRTDGFDALCGKGSGN